VIWEIVQYDKTHDASGHSITQRLEYWKAATGIIQSNPVIGVGTGDVPAAFEGEYESNKTLLKKEWRFRSHNQYLSIAVAFGFLGLIWFLFSLIYPGIYFKKFGDFLYVSFFIIATVSFFTEDTLETQVGVTFFAFLNSFLLFTGNSQTGSGKNK
jgi:O-antigen ligase